MPIRHPAGDRAPGRCQERLHLRRERGGRDRSQFGKHRGGFGGVLVVVWLTTDARNRSDKFGTKVSSVL